MEVTNIKSKVSCRIVDVCFTLPVPGQNFLGSIPAAFSLTIINGCRAKGSIKRSCDFLMASNESTIWGRAAAYECTLECVISREVSTVTRRKANCCITNKTHFMMALDVCPDKTLASELKVLGRWQSRWQLIR